MVRRSFLAMIAAVTAASTVAAQEAPRAPGFTSEMHVNTVTVDVQVRDAAGAPVLGLRKGDFRIFEDGKPEPVTNFLAVEGSTVSGSDGAGLKGEPTSRQLLVFFDLYMMSEADKRPLVASLREHVASGLPPGLTVAVVSYNGTLRVHTPPTASRDKVLAALDDVAHTGATGLQQSARLAAFVHRPQVSESRGSVWGRQLQTEEYWNEMRLMVSRVEDAFTATLQTFADTPARKLALLASPGFPRSDATPVTRYYDAWAGHPVRFRNAGLLGRAAMLASELEYTLYTLDPSGNQLLTADRSPAFDDAANVAFWREADRKDTLLKAAELTGGEAISTIDGGAALADVERLSSTYYSLAYQPDHDGDGQEHAIRVEVVGHPEYRLTHRSRYVDRPFAVRDAERTRSALLMGDTANPLGVTLILDRPNGRFRLGARGLHVYRIDAELRIPYANLVMIGRGEVSWGQVQVVVIGVNADGDQSRLSERTIPIQIDPAKLPEARDHGYFSYRFTLELEGGRQSVRVAVNDVLAHTTSTAIARLEL